MNLGLRPSSFTFIYNAPNLLKKDLLYFDQVHICSFSKLDIFHELESTDPKFLDYIQKELQPLRDNHLVHSFNLTEILKFVTENVEKGNPELRPFLDAVMQIPKPLSADKFPRKPSDKVAKRIIEQYQESLNLSEEAVTRVSSLFLNKYSQDAAIPLLQKDFLIGNSKQEKVLEVILSKIPVPDEQVPWQKIIEYRMDPDTSAKFTALRVWMQDISRQDYSMKEISDRVDHLLNEYERHLTYHKLKYTRGTLQVYLTALSEIVENLVTLKFSKVTETIFSLTEKKLNLLEAEMQAPGRELAYVSKAKNI